MKTAFFDITWPAVTLQTDGSPLSDVFYEVEVDYDGNTSTFVTKERTLPVSFSGENNLFSVRVRAGSGKMFGDWSDLIITQISPIPGRPIPVVTVTPALASVSTAEVAPSLASRLRSLLPW